MSSAPSAIDGVAQCGGSRWERFKEVAKNVIQHEITWERIALLFYVAGRLAVKVGPEVVPLVGPLYIEGKNVNDFRVGGAIVGDYAPPHTLKSLKP